MKISVISFTRAGAEKNLELTAVLQEKNHQAASYSWHKFTGRKLIPFQSLKLLFADLWDSQEVFLFLGDMEKVAGALLPFSKEHGMGPAAVIMDEEGRYVIPFSKGRMQGLNGWCTQFAQTVGAMPVIMSPSEASSRFAVDAFARRNGLHIQDLFRVQTLAAALSEGEKVGIYSDYPVDGVMPEGMVGIGAVMMDEENPPAKTPECGISITDDWEAPHFAKECRMYPRNLALGIVCDPGCPSEELEQFVYGVLAQNHLSRERVSAVYSLSELAKEAGIVEFADRLDIPYYTYSRPQLSGQSAEGGELCENCAKLGSGHGKCIVFCEKSERLSVSVYEKTAVLHF